MEKYRRKLPPEAGDDRAAYGAMVETLDHLVGRVLRELDALDLSRNTVVIFTSDNGGHPNYSANGPLRGSKWNLYEGGIRVPMIVRWPSVVKPASICSEPITGCDLFPTLQEIGCAIPDQIGRDGVSLLSVLRGEPVPKNPRSLIWHFPYYHPETGFDEAPASIGVNDFVTSQTRPHSAIHRGNYKLIHFYETGVDELYDLAADLSEQHDLASIEINRTREMREQLDQYLQRVITTRLISTS